MAIDEGSWDFAVEAKHTDAELDFAASMMVGTAMAMQKTDPGAYDEAVASLKEKRDNFTYNMNRLIALMEEKKHGTTTN